MLAPLRSTAERPIRATTALLSKNSERWLGLPKDEPPIATCFVTNSLAAHRFTWGQLEWSAQAQQAGWRHGLSLFGGLKYSPDFKQFDYVDASPPKGE